MRKIILSLLLLIAVSAVAQQTIKGTVTDSRGDAMPFVTISVLTQDSALITGTITDEQGKYNIELPHSNSQPSTLHYPGFVCRLSISLRRTELRVA